MKEKEEIFLREWDISPIGEERILNKLQLSAHLIHSYYLLYIFSHHVNKLPFSKLSSLRKVTIAILHKLILLLRRKCNKNNFLQSDLLTLPHFFIIFFHFWVQKKQLQKINNSQISKRKKNGAIIFFWLVYLITKTFLWRQRITWREIICRIFFGWVFALSVNVYIMNSKKFFQELIFQCSNWNFTNFDNSLNTIYRRNLRKTILINIYTFKTLRMRGKVRTGKWDTHM